MKERNLKYFLLGAFVVSAGLWGLAVTLPNSFNAGDVISAAKINANFAAIKAAVDALESAITGKQARVTGTCPAGSSLGQINADGTVVCQQGPSAYGQIREDGSIRNGSPNITGVTHTATGQFCITFSNSISQERIESAVVSMAGSKTNGIYYPRNEMGQGDFVCSGLGVVITDVGGNYVNGRFSFVVP